MAFLPDVTWVTTDDSLRPPAKYLSSASLRRVFSAGDDVVAPAWHRGAASWCPPLSRQRLARLDVAGRREGGEGREERAGGGRRGGASLWASSLPAPRRGLLRLGRESSRPPPGARGRRDGELHGYVPVCETPPGQGVRRGAAMESFSLYAE